MGVYSVGCGAERDMLTGKFLGKGGRVKWKVYSRMMRGRGGQVLDRCRDRLTATWHICIVTILLSGGMINYRTRCTKGQFFECFF